MDLMCSWCHGMNSANGLALTPYCIFCGHRADVPRSQCDCPKCWKPVDGVDEPGLPTRPPRADFLERLAAWHAGTASIERDATIQRFHAEAARVVRDVTDEHAALLAALKGILAGRPELWGDQVVHGRTVLTIDEDAADAADRAIAKAEGR